MSELLISRSMALLAVGYGSALLSQIGRFILPLLPPAIAVGLIIVVVAIGGGTFGLALYQERDRFVAYGSLLAIALGLVLGGSL
ncbi:MAG: hypothetical protein SAJ12_22425 [Jaaginema sp. PMC 1079.18]|nr:hypothetical protein [Jaaginema sp. PMC 1080.18]MEC4853745.1 hypothetical protein [Jaaginema sp. PMC 1079.18]MEC4868889.1 hypothetical protein [Jaaginema sp. PMC 1078.18]